jgi:hypothetical protein
MNNRGELTIGFSSRRGSRVCLATPRSFPLQLTRPTCHPERARRRSWFSPARDEGSAFGCFLYSPLHCSSVSVATQRVFSVDQNAQPGISALVEGCTAHSAGQLPFLRVIPKRAKFAARLGSPVKRSESRDLSSCAALTTHALGSTS